MVKQLGYRPALPTDLAWLVALRVGTMDAYLTRSGESLTREDHEARVRQDFAWIQIVTLSEGALPDRDIGMVKVVQRADHWHLVQIQLLPAEQNSGYGTQVLRSVIEKANAAGMLLKLSVLKVNPAKHLYERLGFTVQSESEHSYRMALQPSGVGRCEVSGGEER